MPQSTISKSSIRILKVIDENEPVTQTDISEELGLSFTAISRHFRKDYDYNFLNQIVQRTKDEGDDGREIELTIREGKREEAETLINALNIVEKYEDEE